MYIKSIKCENITNGFSNDIINVNNNTIPSGILHPLLVALSKFYTSLPGIPTRKFIVEDVEDNISSFKFEVTLVKEDSTILPMIFSGNIGKVKMNKEIKDYSSLLKYSDDNTNASLPIFVYYNMHDYVADTYVNRDYSFTNVYPRYKAYLKSLDDITDFKRFFMWFDRMEDTERREWIKECEKVNKNVEYSKKELDVVRNALNMSNCAYKDIHTILEDRIRVVADNDMHIEDMNENDRREFMIIVDIASRMAEANSKSLDDPLQSEGVVIINGMSSTITNKLNKIFPTVQFITCI